MISNSRILGCLPDQGSGGSGAGARAGAGGRWPWHGAGASCHGVGHRGEGGYARGGSPAPARLGRLDERERGTAARMTPRADKGAAERDDRWQPLERGMRGRGPVVARGGQAWEAGSWCGHGAGG